MKSDDASRMSGWRTWILKEFPEASGELILISDPDGLMADESLQTAIRDRDYDIVPYEDPMVFRALYERNWRERLERNTGGSSLAVTWALSAAEMPSAVPFDLLVRGRRVNVSLARLFPKLAPISLIQLEPRHLDILWSELKGDDSGQRGPESSRDLLLDRVFELNVSSIIRAKRPAVRLLSSLLRLHFQGHRLPRSLVDRAVSQLRGVAELDTWPLTALFGDRAEFLAFLQHQWGVWIHLVTKAGAPRVSEPLCGWGSGAPLEVPFDDKDVSIWMDSYFIHGLLAPVPLPTSVHLPTWHNWASVGIEQDARKDACKRLDRLLEELAIPGEQAQWTDWRNLAAGLAEGAALLHASELEDSSSQANQLASRLALADEAFLTYLLKRYGSLASLPHFSGPVMVHHVPRYMADRLADGAKRVALLVLDGLALDQWALIHSALPPLGMDIRAETTPIFAWIPTLTSVSRQAIFAGNPPRDFAPNIYETSGEQTWWRRFWDKHNVPAGQVKYLGIIDAKAGPEIVEAIEDTGVRVIGAVIGLVDNLIHDFPLPRGDLVPTLLGWARKGGLTNLIGALLEGGFEVCITADHGNVQAKGTGAPSEGKLADIRGERARVYNSETLRSNAAAQCPDAISWPGTGLPADFHTLLAPSGTAFVRKGESLICHGGASLLEVFVPFVHIRRGER